MDAVLYLSTNCPAFRGSSETPSDLITQYPQPSQGNFLNLISLLVKSNSCLKFQLENLKKGQVSYLSKTMQNEIIEIMAKTVRNSILNDIKEAKYYTIMFDCTPDVSHIEQMSQVIRHVKRSGDVCEIKESFIDFIEVAGKTGEDICQQILEKLAVDDLDIGQCRGQCYDNGFNMANIHKGVQARIAEKNGLAHSLNLVEHYEKIHKNKIKVTKNVVLTLFCKTNEFQNVKKIDKMCEDELPLLQPVQLFSKEIMMVFDRIIS
nr:unnamed protein product [Callosobruchus analis]